MREKPTPPPSPSFPLVTLDGIVSLFVGPLTNPFFTLLPPLIVLALNPNSDSPAFVYSCVFTVVTLALQFLAFLNKLVAGGPRRHLDWDNEVVLITGGCGGLGRVLAEYYGSIQRCSTVAVDVLPADVQRCAEWEAHGCVYCQCDVGDFDAVVSLRRRVESELGSVSILILAAGIVNSKSVLELQRTDVEQSVNVNLLGAIWCIKAFLPRMLRAYSLDSEPGGESESDDDQGNTAKPGATIVTVSSVLGYLGAAGLADYTATKAALIAFHESVRAEIALSSSQRRVNLILATPGQLATPMFAHVPSPPLATVLGPTVTPASLAAKIIRAVEQGKDDYISMPLYAEWIGVLRVLPAGLVKLLRAAVGLDAAGWAGTEIKRKNRLDDGGKAK